MEAIDLFSISIGHKLVQLADRYKPQKNTFFQRLLEDLMLHLSFGKCNNQRKQSNKFIILRLQSRLMKKMLNFSNTWKDQ